ncbi:MAG: TonB family protein [Muribaculaceae bacterium]|nr:TonB family protein [Muribaculaceae bacterium]
MGSFLVDTLFSSLVMIVAFVIYKLLLSGEKQIAFNRMTLLATYVLSLISLPLCRLDFDFIGNSQANPIIEIGTLTPLGAVREVQVETATSNVPEIIIATYLAGAGAVLLLNFISIIRLIRIIRSGVRVRQGKYTLVIVPDKEVAPFSFGKYIVIGNLGLESADELVTSHEFAHINARHYIDLIVAQIACVLLWYNPAAWMMRDELRLIHEYQADADVLDAGADPRDYQMLLIKRAVGNKFSLLANGFSQHKLKNRITMMQKEKSKGMRRLSAIALAIAPVVALTVVNIPAVAAGLEKLDSKPMNDELQSVANPIERNVAVESEIPVESSDEATVEEMPAIASSMEVQTPQPTDNDMHPAPAADESSTSTDNNKNIYVAVDEMAEFPGGMPELMKYLAMNIRYPKEAHDENIQGRVVIKFIINEDGSVSDATVIKGVSKELDEEATRVVMSMPKWTPGKAGGKAVASYYTIPISFKLQSSEKKDTAENAAVTVVAHK